MINIKNAIKDASIELKKNNIASYLLDSEILMAEVLKKDRKYILLNFNEKIGLKEYQKFKNLINLRSKRKPIAYLIGKKSFWKSDFKVSNDILIPRPDTEIIIEEVLKLSKNKSKSNILDIGVGSGCILLSILSEKKEFYGTGIDKSQKCLNISKFNAKTLKVLDRVKFFKSDIDNFNLGKYDLIVSNPPYINTHNLKYLEKDVVGFEPKLALDGGKDGTSEIRKVVNKSSELLKKRGKLVLEIAFDQKDKVKKLLINKGFYINKILKDLANNDRCIVSTKI